MHQQSKKHDINSRAIDERVAVPETNKKKKWKRRWSVMLQNREKKSGGEASEERRKKRAKFWDKESVCEGDSSPKWLADQHMSKRGHMKTKKK